MRDFHQLQRMSRNDSMQFDIGDELWLARVAQVSGLDNGSTLESSSDMILKFWCMMGVLSYRWACSCPKGDISSGQ